MRKFMPEILVWQQAELLFFAFMLWTKFYLKMRSWTALYVLKIKLFKFPSSYFIAAFQILIQSAEQWMHYLLLSFYRYNVIYKIKINIKFNQIRMTTFFLSNVCQWWRSRSRQREKFLGLKWRFLFWIDLPNICTSTSLLELCRCRFMAWQVYVPASSALCVCSTINVPLGNTFWRRFRGRVWPSKIKERFRIDGTYIHIYWKETMYFITRKFVVIYDGLLNIK